MVTLILLFSESTQSAACCIVGPSDGEGAPPGDPIKWEPREGVTGQGVSANELCSVQRGTELISRTFHRLPRGTSGGGALIRSLGQSTLYRRNGKVENKH